MLLARFITSCREHFLERLTGYALWHNRAHRRHGHLFQKRILGNGEFVEGVLRSAEDAMEKRYALRSRGFDLEKTAARAAEVLGVKEEDIWAKGRYRRIVEARSFLCYWAVRELGVTMSSLAVRLGISIPAVSKSVSRGKDLAVARGCSLIVS